MKEILKFKPELRTKLKVLPHGNNSKEYFPTEIGDFRKSYFGDNADKFIITNINRNQPRKDITNSIFSFLFKYSKMSYFINSCLVVKPPSTLCTNRHKAKLS